MMRRRQSGLLRRAWVLVLTMPAALALPAAAQTAVVPSGGSDTSLQIYRNHLQALDALVAKCRKQRTPQACNSSQVGADDKVTWPAGGASAEREVPYDWLRDLLERAGQKEVQASPSPTQMVKTQVIKTPVLTIDQQLELAQHRLEGDLQQAGGSAAETEDYGGEHQALTAILARREYQGTNDTSVRDRFNEWLENKIAEFLDGVARVGARAPWIGYVLEALLVGGLATALIWALIRLERRYRVRLTPEVERVSSAPSAREWQLWLRDAQQMAAQGRWREAIHFLYWASISRLEGMRLWPADSARTPREYLRLLSGTDPRRENLTALTRSFERTWYGGREAGSTDFQAASQMAAGLGVE
jgi:hypothetical protein